MIKNPARKALSILIFLAAFFIFVRYGLDDVPKPLSRLEARSQETVAKVNEVPGDEPTAGKEHPVFNLPTLKVTLIRKSADAKVRKFEISGDANREHLVRILELVKESGYFKDEIVRVIDSTIRDTAAEAAQSTATAAANAGAAGPLTPDKAVDGSPSVTEEAMNQEGSYITIEDKFVVFSAAIPDEVLNGSIQLQNLFKLIEIFAS